MRVTVEPGWLRGTLPAVPSKSYAHRILLAAALADRPTVIVMENGGADVVTTLTCLKALGAKVDQSGNVITLSPVTSARPSQAITLSCGESGSSLRFLLPMCCSLGVTVEITGEGRLPARPLTPLIEQLRLHGARIEGKSLPLRVSGRLTGGIYRLPGDESSQYLTGLLLTLPTLAEDSIIELSSPLESKGYVDMTLAVLARFGINVTHDARGYHVPGRQRWISPSRLAIQGDWSSAAFWAAASAMGSRICVEGLTEASLQPDAAIVPMLRRLKDGGQHSLDLSGMPDLMPILAVAATWLPGTTRLEGLKRLRLKESDRLAAMAEGLGRLGAKIETETDTWHIQGGQRLHGGVVDAYGDHRIAMALAIAATAATAPVSIDGAEAVAKSYPDFWADFKRVGGMIHVEPDR